MTQPDGPYDGNALAGPLSEVFAVEVTAAVAQCRGCGRVRSGRRARGLRARARAGRPLPGLLRRPAARRADAGRGLARPRRDQLRCASPSRPDEFTAAVPDADGAPRRVNPPFRPAEHDPTARPEATE